MNMIKKLASFFSVTFFFCFQRLNSSNIFTFTIPSSQIPYTQIKTFPVVLLSICPWKECPLASSNPTIHLRKKKLSSVIQVHSIFVLPKVFSNNSLQTLSFIRTISQQLLR